MTNRIELTISRSFPFAEAYEFGTVGAYERLVGRVNFATDPHTPAQRGITDLDKAPTDSEGLVHFAGDFSILKPVDPACGNPRLFLRKDGEEPYAGLPGMASSRPSNDCPRFAVIRSTTSAAKTGIRRHQTPMRS
jgi:hypothetical protein